MEFHDQRACIYYGRRCDKTANSLKVLERTKYLKRVRVYQNGKIIDWEYRIFDEPYEPADPDPKEAKKQSASIKNVESSVFIPSQDTENLNQGNEDIENQYAYKKTKEEKTKKELLSEEISIKLFLRSRTLLLKILKVGMMDRLMDISQKKSN